MDLSNLKAAEGSVHSDNFRSCLLYTSDAADE